MCFMLFRIPPRQMRTGLGEEALPSFQSSSIYLCYVKWCYFTQLFSSHWSGMGEQWEWQHCFLSKAVPYNFCRET